MCESLSSACLKILTKGHPKCVSVFCPIPTLNRSHLKSEGLRGKVWHLMGYAGVNKPRGKFHSEVALQEPRGEASPVRVGYWRWYPRQMEAGRAPRDGTSSSKACVFMKKMCDLQTNTHISFLFLFLSFSERVPPKRCLHFKKERIY